MAKVKVSRKVTRSVGKKPKPKPLEVVLPTEPTVPSLNFRDYSLLVHGEKKIGKTTLFAQEEKAFFMEWDPEQRALPIIQQAFSDWATFKAYVREMQRQAKVGKLPYRTVIVDGADLMYDACFEWACKKLVITHPHDEDDFGKSWRFIKDAYLKTVLDLLRLPGVATRFICHSTWKEQKDRRGATSSKLVPNLTKQAEEVLTGLVDLWGAYCYDGRDRVLVVRGDEQTGAGHRIDHRFKTTDGRLVEEIDMGTSPSQAYANLLAAFDCTQDYATLAELRERRKAATKKKGGRVKRKSTTQSESRE
jgi:hypothetical protein